ncbi:MAG: substrate-binding domain-containing protein [Ignavibacteriales bacterium]|nr:substrate-binding domain-containing protein [Ignavibacteriales bacterium]
MYTSASIVRVAAIALFLGTCNPEPAETPTKGKLHLLLAESVAPAVVRQVDQFMDYYRQNGANVTFSLVSSENAINGFVRDTLRTVFVTRALWPAEREAVEHSHGSFLKMTVAYDAVAVVVHQTNPLDGITVSDIRDILSGKTKRWGQLKVGKKSRRSMRVYLQDSSDISFYLSTRIANLPAISVKMQQRLSSLNLLYEVSKDPTAIGFVGLSWMDSVKVPIKVLKVAAAFGDTDTAFAAPAGALGKFFSPHAAYIHQNSYALKRAVYMYSKSLGGDLAAGFSSFVATSEGQRIFLNHGLVPGTQEIVLKKTR